MTLAAIAYLRPQTRPRIAPIIGAVSPLLLAYVATWVAWLLSDRSPEASFGVHAMWVMSFFVYLLALVIGVALGFARRPVSISWRFALAALVSPLTIGMFLLIERGWQAITTRTAERPLPAETSTQVRPKWDDGV